MLHSIQCLDKSMFSCSHYLAVFIIINNLLDLYISLVTSQDRLLEVEILVKRNSDLNKNIILCRNWEFVGGETEENSLLKL